MAYKLTYFNIRGRAEPSRFIFAQAGVAYQDIRIPFDYDGEEWKKLKPTTPTGRIPVLEVDGKPLAGSKLIDRFLAERFGLAGSNDLENAQIASIVDMVNDFFETIVRHFKEEDGEQKTAKRKDIEDNIFPEFISTLDRIFKKNGSEAGWSFGDKPTYADFNIYCCIECALFMFPDILDNYPFIAKLKAAVEALPNISCWLKERPQTMY